MKYGVKISAKDMDSKLRYSGRFYIKLKVDEGSKLDNLFLTNNTGIINNWDLFFLENMNDLISDLSRIEVASKNDESNESQLWSFGNNKIRCLMTDR